MAQNKKEDNEDNNAGKHHSGMEGKTGTEQHSGKNVQFNSGSGGVTERNTNRTGAGSAQTEIRGRNETGTDRPHADHAKKSAGKDAGDEQESRH